MGASVSGGRRKTGRNEFLLARRLDNNTICRRISSSAQSISFSVRAIGSSGASISAAPEDIIDGAQ